MFLYFYSYIQAADVYIRSYFRGVEICFIPYVL